MEPAKMLRNAGGNVVQFSHGTDAASEILLDVAGLARALSLSPGAVRSMRKRREIPSEVIVRFGRRLRFHRGRVREWIERLSEQS